MIFVQRIVDDSPTEDYYGTIYKGSLIIPVLLIIALGLTIWWVIKKGRS